MKILYIASLDFYSKPNPSFHLMTSMLEDILKNGISVFLIGCKEDGIQQHIPSSLLNNTNFSFELVKTKPIKKSKFLKRFFAGIKYSKSISKIIKKEIDSCDIVFIQSSPTVYYTIKRVKKYSGSKKVLYNIQDMFPGSSIACGAMKNKLVQKFFFRMQKRAYKMSDIITVISEDMQIKVEQQGVATEKIKVIVNWFDDSTVHFVPWEDNRFVKKYNMNRDDFYIQYAGTMGYVFDYKVVLELAKQLQDYKNIKIQMIGEGSQKQQFINEVSDKQLDNISFLPLEPQDMVSDVYSACSVCLIPLKKGVIGNSVPSKAGLLMACKRPIVSTADDDSIYCDMLNKNKVGFGVSTDNINKVIESIMFFYNDRNRIIEYGENGFNFGKDLFSRSLNMKKYIQLFEEIVKE